MTILTVPGKRRSNRALTARAIEATIEYLNGEKRTEWDLGNTRAFVDDYLDFNITLFHQPILKLVKENGKISEVQVFSGGVYDEDGNPKPLTRERLNGLLDALGAEGLIPENVRVWIDRECNVCYLVHFDEKQVLNKHYCTMVGINASPGEFKINNREVIFQRSDSEK